MRIISLLLLVSTIVSLPADDATPPLFFEDICADYPIPDSYQDKENYHKRLWYYLQNPVLLTHDTIDIWVEMGLVTHAQATAFVNYTTHYGEINTIEKLAVIPHWEATTIARLRPFIKMPQPKKKRKKRSRKVQHTCKIYGAPKYDQAKASDKGNCLAYSLMYKGQHKDYQYGFIHQKGVGEPINASYCSGYLAMEKDPDHLLQRLIVGRFEYVPAQGLLISTQQRRPNQYSLKNYFNFDHIPIRPANTSARNPPLQGVALHWGHENLEGIAFYSYKTCSVTTYDDKDANREYFKAISKTYRWSPKKKPLQQILYGGTLHYTPTEATKIGIQYLHYDYDYFRQLNNQYIKENGHLSLFGHYQKDNIALAGEVTGFTREDIGLSLAGELKLNKKEHIRLALQKYGPAFDGFHTLANPNVTGVSFETRHFLQETIDCTHLFHLFSKEKNNTPVWEGTYTLSTKYKAPCKDLWEGKLKLQYRKKGLFINPSCKYTYQKKPFKYVTHLSTLCYPHIGLGLCENITYQQDNTTLKFHATGFYTPEAPLYFHQPDLKAPALFPQTKGIGLRLGTILSYKWNAQHTFQTQGYITFKKPKSAKENACKIGVKVQWIYKQ